MRTDSSWSWASMCASTDHEHGCAAPLCLFGGQHVVGLRDQGGPLDLGDPAEGGDDGGVDAAYSDVGVAEVDGDVPGRARRKIAAPVAAVLPAPTSPVTTPNARSATHQAMAGDGGRWPRSGRHGGAAWRVPGPARSGSSTSLGHHGKSSSLSRRGNRAERALEESGTRAGRTRAVCGPGWSEAGAPPVGLGISRELAAGAEAGRGVVLTGHGASSPGCSSSTPWPLPWSEAC